MFVLCNLFISVFFFYIFVFAEYGIVNGHGESPAVQYENFPKRVPGRGRAMVAGLGRGISPMGMSIVPPPPGFGSRGRASTLGIAGE